MLNVTHRNQNHLTLMFDMHSHTETENLWILFNQSVCLREREQLNQIPNAINISFNHKIGQRPLSILIFPHFSPNAMSAPLNHPEPFCPTFLVPAAQVSLNTSWLYPLPSIRLYCWCGMPGMSTGSPILSIHPQQSTMQVHACACPDGFPQRSEFQWKNWHWYLQTWQDVV